MKHLREKEEIGFEKELSDLRNKYKSKNIDLVIYPSSKVIGGATLSRIEVPKIERGKGFATKAMIELISIADRYGEILRLSPTSEFGASKEKLKEFYKRFGFVENKGKNKDYKISETMYRRPKFKHLD